MVKKSIGMVREAFKEKKTILKAFFWGIVTLLVIYLFALLTQTVLPKNDYELMQIAQQTTAHIWLFAVVSLVYILAAIFAYSFFKTIIISIVQKKNVAKDSFNSLGSFFLFNIVAVIILTIAFTILSSLFAYIFEGARAASIALIIIFALLAYPFFIYSQLFFLKKLKIFSAMKSGFKLLFSELGEYARIVITDAVCLAIILIFFLAFGSIYKSFVASQTAMIYVDMYNLIFIAVISLLFIFLSAYNLYFLNKIFAEKRKLPKLI